MSEEKNGTADFGKLNFAGVTEDDFKSFLKEKVKNHVCPCCGENSWAVVTVPNMSFGLVAFPKSGGFPTPPPSMPIMCVACNTCGYIREHALGLVARWKANKKAES